MSIASDLPSKLERLSKECQRLEAHRQLSLKEFLASPTIQGDTCYLLITTFRGALDIATGLLDDLGLPQASDEADVLALLAEKEVLSQICVSQLTAMQGLCTSLFQHYEEIDPQWVFQTLQVNLVGLNQFVAQVQAYLDR
jgi:uncharacterized protein YutE (UPF0331/DUF86 family)